MILGQMFVLVVILLGTASHARQDVAAPNDPKFEQLAALVTRKMSEYRIPGVAFGVLKNGRMTMKGLGITNADFLTEGNYFVFTNVYDFHARVIHNYNISNLVRNESVDIVVAKN